MATAKHYQKDIPSSKTVFFVYAVFTFLDTYRAQESAIDAEHLKDYPYCGDWKASASRAKNRAANAKIPKNDYRWVVLVIRIVHEGKEDETNDRCSGSVITDR